MHHCVSIWDYLLDYWHGTVLARPQPPRPRFDFYIRLSLAELLQFAAIKSHPCIARLGARLHDYLTRHLTNTSPDQPFPILRRGAFDGFISIAFHDPNDTFGTKATQQVFREAILQLSCVLDGVRRNDVRHRMTTGWTVPVALSQIGIQPLDQTCVVKGVATG